MDRSNGRTTTEECNSNTNTNTNTTVPVATSTTRRTNTSGEGASSSTTAPQQPPPGRSASTNANANANTNTNTSTSTNSGGERRSHQMQSHRRMSSRRLTKRNKRKAAAAAVAAVVAQEELQRQWASLQLPHMPASFVVDASTDATTGADTSAAASPPSQTHTHTQTNSKKKSNEPPTIRILVVADIDLDSASALAECALSNTYTKTDKNNNNNTSGPGGEEENPLQRVDLCIACGPFTQEEDLRQYYQGRQRRRHLARQFRGMRTTSSSSSSAVGWSKRGGSSSGNGDGGMAGSHGAWLPLPPMPPLTNHHSSSSRHQYHQQCDSYSTSFQHHPSRMTSASSLPPPPYPFKRTREETAALEGLMTAALSQLESIVCRVVFVPGKTDPVTTITSTSTTDSARSTTDSSTSNKSNNKNMISYTKERRLTPNSRNLHQQWMPLCPGLGCAGLLYLDGPKLLQQQPPPPLEDDDDDHDDDDDDDHEVEDDDDDSEDSSSSVMPGDEFIYPLDAKGGGRPATYATTANRDTTTSGTEPSATATTTPSTFDERSKEYGQHFCHQLQELVHLAPPLEAVSDTPSPQRQITDLLHTTLFQSILVSHFHHLEQEEEEDNTVHTSPSPSPQQEGTVKEEGDIASRRSMRGPGVVTPSGGGGSNSSLLFSVPSPQHEELDDEGDDDDDDDYEAESFDPPWPMEHEAFCARPDVQEHVVLEIAAGRNAMGRVCHPMELPKGPTMRVILPGSLRERGEFCIVDLAFSKAPVHAPRLSSSTPSRSGGPPKPQDDYRWMVRRTRFQTLNDYL